MTRPGHQGGSSMIPGVAVYHPRSEWEAADQAMATSFTRQGEPR